MLVDELLSSVIGTLTISLFAKGERTLDIEYDLELTPCEKVMDKRLCVYQECLQVCFPRDDLPVTMKAESCMGMPLCDPEGEPLG